MKKHYNFSTICDCLNQYLLTPAQTCEHCGGMVPSTTSAEMEEERFCVAYFEELEDQIARQGFAA